MNSIFTFGLLLVLALHLMTPAEGLQIVDRVHTPVGGAVVCLEDSLLNILKRLLPILEPLLRDILSSVNQILNALGVA